MNPRAASRLWLNALVLFLCTAAFSFWPVAADDEQPKQYAIEFRLKELKVERLGAATLAYDFWINRFSTGESEDSCYDSQVERALLSAQLAASPLGEIPALEWYTERTLIDESHVKALHTVGAWGGEQERLRIATFNRLNAQAMLYQAALTADSPVRVYTDDDLRKIGCLHVTEQQLTKAKSDRIAEVERAVTSIFDVLQPGPGFGRFIEAITMIEAKLALELADANSADQKVELLEQNVARYRKLEASIVTLRQVKDFKYSDDKSIAPLATKLCRRTAEIKLLRAKLDSSSKTGPAGNRKEADKALQADAQFKRLVAGQTVTGRILLTVAKSGFEQRSIPLSDVIGLWDVLLSADQAAAVTPGQQIEALQQNVERNSWLERWLEAERSNDNGYYYFAKVNRLTAQIKLIEAQIAQLAQSKG